MPEKLALISLRDIPDRGARALESRDVTLSSHRNNAIGNGVLAVIANTTSLFLWYFMWEVLWLVRPSLLISTLVAMFFLGITGLSIYLYRETALDIEGYLNNHNVTKHLPEGSSEEDARCEIHLRQFAMDYNAVAKQWNALSDEGCDSELEGKEALGNIIRKNGETIRKAIAFLKEGKSLKTLPDPESETNPFTARGMLGPSSLIK